MLYLFQDSFIQKFCRAGKVAEIQRLIDIYGKNSVITARCCRPDLKTCLHMAAEGGHVDMITLLLDAGADPDKMTRFRFTALHYAVKKTIPKQFPCFWTGELWARPEAKAIIQVDSSTGFRYFVQYCIVSVLSRLEN